MSSFVKYFVASLMLTSSIVSASPSPLFSRNLRARGGTYAITGIHDNGIQPRLEIRKLSEDTVMFNLYLLSVIQFKAINQETLLSWYQIAGIHGYPLVPWDGVQAIANVTGALGYCTHSSNLFGPWHRPYLALFEQQIHAIGLEIAAQFGTSEYKTAALKLRQPYWDWAIVPTDGLVIPAVFSNPTTQVTFPNGTVSTINNPLYTYRFHPFITSDFAGLGNYSVWLQTLRTPSSILPNATSQDSKSEAGMEAEAPNLRSMLMSLFFKLPAL